MLVRAGVCVLTCILLLPCFCAGQGVRVFTIDTLAGGAVYDDRPATQTPLSFPTGLWVDGNGGIWVVDSGNHVIRRIEPSTSTMRVMVGGGTVLDDSVPVEARSVQLNFPGFLDADAAGNIYFTDSGNHRVRRLSPDGQVVTVVGTGDPGLAGDGGPAGLARLNSPSGLAIDAAGNLYINDTGNCRIRRVDASGVITTFAGTRCGPEAGDGSPAQNATFSGGAGAGLHLDVQGNLYIAAGTRIRRIDLGTGIITTVAGNDSSACAQPFQEGPALTRGLCQPQSILSDPDGTVYFTEDRGLFRLSLSGNLSRLAEFNSGTGLARDSNQRFVFTMQRQGFVQRLDGAGRTSFIAGTRQVFDGPALRAVLVFPSSAGLDAAGNLYVSEPFSGRIRKFDAANGQIATVAGANPTLQLADDVPALNANIFPQSMAVDSQGNIFLGVRPSLWRINADTGTLTRVAGNPMQSGFAGDNGPATQALLSGIAGIAIDAAGNIYFSDYPNRRIRRIAAGTSTITTIAGTGDQGNSGDGGPATAATFDTPLQLALDGQGNLLVSDRVSIRRINLATGIISTLQSRLGQGQPLRNTNFGGWLAVDREGNIFVGTKGPSSASHLFQIRAADSVLVRLISGADGFLGDGGLAALARFAFTSDRTGGGRLAAAPSGVVYLSDTKNGRLRALTPTAIRPVMALSPNTLRFTVGAGAGAPGAQALRISSRELVGFNWTLEVATSAGGNWLRPGATSGTAPSTVNITVDASPLAPGTYRGTVSVRAPDASNSPQSAEVVLTVQPAPGPVLGVSHQFLSFQGVQGGANPAAQTIAISNAGSGTLNWTATAETNVGGPWLRLSATSGTAPASLTLSADITGLAQGTYQGQITVRNAAGGEPRVISVVLTVTRSQPILLPTQTGFLFAGLEGSLVIGAQSFAIQNAGQGRMDWQIQVNLPSGGDWLRVSPLAGTSEAGRPAPEVTLQVDPTRLRAGVYVALLSITAAGALNSPQTAIVLAHIAQRGSAPVGLVIPPGLIFTAPAGASAALSRSLTLGSTGGQPLSFLVRARTQAGGNWLAVTPEQGTLLSSSESLSLQVEARPAGLSAGVYFGSVTFGFGTGATQEVAVALVIASGTSTVGALLAAPSGGASPAPTVAPGAAAAPGPWTLDLGPWTSSADCTPRRLVVLETRLGSNFALEVGWPAPLLAQTVDDCGTPIGTATVTASFTTGEPPLVFQNLRNGQYSATWVPAARGQAGITIRAVQRGLEDGVAQLAGTLGGAQAGPLPLVFREGWVNAASYDRFKPLAPGMIFSVFGNNLGEAPTSATQIPLPRELSGLRVAIGGREAPLFYSDSGQVNAQVPFELEPGAASLVASRRGAAGAPGTLTLVATQPGIFTMSQTGTGQGAVVNTAGRVVDSNNPAGAGDVVLIFATGLGLTEPRVGSGEAAPRAPLARVVAPLTVTIGGREAVVEFAGLAPDLVGLYQVNARVPAGVAPGPAVPLVLTQNGLASNTVTIALR